MKKLIASLLVLASLIAAFGSVSLFTAFAASSHVYMIVTNPGEDSNTQMGVGFHSDWGYTNCYVQYTVASDTGFTKAKKATPVSNTEAYTWFYGHATTNAGGTPFTTKFIDWDTVLTGLTPNTDYIYRVCDGTDYSKTYKFKTGGADNFSILWTSDAHVNSGYSERLSDWNGIFSYIEGKAKYPIGFHFSTGDTVAIGDRYKDWLSVANTAFSQNYMLANVVGNHDVYDSSMAKDPAYTQYFKSSEYFKYVYANPKNAYVQTSQRLEAYLKNDGIADPDGSKAKEDTNGKNYWFMYGKCLFVVFDYWSFNYGAQEVKNAFNWASGVIKANEGKYDYLICSDHLNLIWGHGGGSRYYEDKYLNFLDSNNVDIFLAGDNHIWLRTDRLYNKQVTTDTSKGTYIIQAPCISRSQNVTVNSGAGYAVMQYSVAGSTLGSTVIDVTPSGMTFTMYAKESGSYKKIDSVTIPKKKRAAVSTDTGIYTTKSAVDVKEYASASAKTLVSVPASSNVEVMETSNNFGKIRYNGYTGWISLASATFKNAVSTPASVTQYTCDQVNKGYSSGNTLNAYTNSYGSTIANGSWSFQYMTTITAQRDSTNAYKVTAVNDDTTVPKKDTAIPSNGVVLLITSGYASRAALIADLAVGKYFTLDESKYRVYPAEPGKTPDVTQPTETEPQPTVTEPKPTETVQTTTETEPRPTETEPAEDELAVSSSTYGKIKDGRLIKAKLGMTADTLKGGFNLNVDIKTADGQKANGNAVIATGMTAGTAKQSVAIVVTGDISGNGKIIVTDYIMAKRIVQGTYSPDETYKLAADIDGDGEYTATDYQAIKLYFKGTQTID